MPSALRMLISPSISPLETDLSKLSEDQSYAQMSADTQHHPLSLHSRDSSSASDFSPITPTFSSRDHSRIASTNSSVSSSPPCTDLDLQCSSTRQTLLDDLVEHPEELEDCYDLGTDPCEARLSQTDPTLPTTNPMPLSVDSHADYDLADDTHPESGSSTPLKSRRASEDIPVPVANLATRFGSRLPSLSRRLKDRTPTTAVTNTSGTRSTPLSRTSSFRIPSLTKALVSHLESYDMNSPPTSPTRSLCDEDGYAEDETTAKGSMPIEIRSMSSKPETADDRQGLSTTPLLPPARLLSEHRHSECGSIQSPLQSPAIADLSNFSTASPSLVGSPVACAVPTPPLSTRPSYSSIARNNRWSIAVARSMTLVPSGEIPSLDIEKVEDEWSEKLGHANFSITPEPYLPKTCDKASCQQLTQDWESARRQYMNQVNHISEHYGPTSQTYKHTEQKWAAIDAQWKLNHETARSNAAADDHDTSEIVPLAATSTQVHPMASFDSPDGLSKFPMFEDATTIVGPMVQYAAKTQTRPSRRASVIKYINDLCRPGAPSK